MNGLLRYKNGSGAGRRERCKDIKALRDSHPGIVVAAVRAVAELGEKALPAVPRLLSLVDHNNTALSPTEDMAIRWEAIAALKKVAPDSASKAVPAMIKILQTGSQFERGRVISLLCDMGANGNAAIPILKKIAVDSADPVSPEAHSILQSWPQIP